MKIELHRDKCSHWQRACENCFANLMKQGNFDSADCGLKVTEDGNRIIELMIHDRHGSTKILTVNPENLGDSHNPWLELAYHLK